MEERCVTFAILLLAKKIAGDPGPTSAQERASSMPVHKSEVPGASGGGGCSPCSGISFCGPSGGGKVNPKRYPKWCQKWTAKGVKMDRIASQRAP